LYITEFFSIRITYWYVNSVICIFPGVPLLSQRLATLTVLPNKQYRGILLPTTPATTSPLLIPILIYREQKMQYAQLGRHVFWLYAIC